MEIEIRSWRVRGAGQATACLWCLWDPRIETLRLYDGPQVGMEVAVIVREGSEAEASRATFEDGSGKMPVPLQFDIPFGGIDDG